MIFRRIFIISFIFSLLSWSAISLSSPDNFDSSGQQLTKEQSQNQIQIPTDQKPDKNINQIMTEIGDVTIKLFPLIFSEKSLSQPLSKPSSQPLSQPLSQQQNQTLYHSVDQLQSLLKETKTYIQTKSPTYQMSYQLFLDYLDSILVKNNPAFLPEIQNHLSILSSFCVSCHTQDNQSRTLFNNTPYNTDSLFKSDLTNAEFNYATRNYRDAHKYYEKYLLSTPNLKDSDVLKHLTRIVSIYTQVLNRPSSAIKALKVFEKDKLFSSEISKYIRESKEALSELHTSNAEEKHLVSFDELRNYVNQYLGSTNMSQGIIFSSYGELVEKMWLRGLLFRYLNNSPTQDQIPYILYWLALCDLSLGNDYDNILADFYIKQCITQYSSHPFAKHCFDEYKSYVTFYYTTPTEPILPFEVNDELNRLKNYLK